MKDIFTTLTESPVHRTLLNLISQSALAPLLREQGPFTLFAPDDDAFQRINLTAVTENPQYLATLLDYHVLEERFSADEIAEKLALVTRSGKALTVQLDEGVQEIDNARYVTTDILCTNGIIHSINNVFLPHFSGWYE